MVAAVVLLVAGCMAADQEVSIPPLSATQGGADSSLGPGTRPLSSGPGYKGSPSWSPRGDRIAFTVDGYVVDKPPSSGGVRRWTTRDFVAEDVEWTSESTLAVFGSSSGSVAGTDDAPRSVYRARSQEGSLEVEEVATKVLAMSPGPEGRGMFFALEKGPYESELALLQTNGAVERPDTKPIGGRVTGISLSPDGRRVALAARVFADQEFFELRVLDLREGVHRRVARLNADLEILGAPQWTKRGICYVAGKEAEAGGESAAPLYDLYLIPPGSDTPEHMPGVGEDFVVSSIRVSPDGGRLAVIGRLNPNSPINLYVLDPETEDLEDLTVNEDMEIKTGPDDLSWSPDGESIAIVARGAVSEEPRVRAAPADTLLEDFYNLYEVPLEEAQRTGR
jgi:Tol biopolymer transport system component